MYYPVSLKVDGQTCLVVGGGKVALQKARSLVRAGARVRVVAPKIARGMPGTLRRRRFAPGDLDGAALAISATDDPDVNRQVYRLARRRGLPVNVVDQPDLCTFIVPSTIRRGGLTIAISTDGGSPSLSKALRKELEGLYPKSFARLTEFLSRARQKVFRALPRTPERFRLLAGLASREVLAEARRGKLGAAFKRVRVALARAGVRV